MNSLLIALALASSPSGPDQEAEVAEEAVDGASYLDCYEALDWFHAIEVANTEAEMLQLALEQRFVEHSRAWIEAASASAPSIEECLDEARERGQPLLWYVPAIEGQHIILPHFIDRYMTVEPFCDPELIALIERRFVAIKRPAAGELAQRFDLVAPTFMEPGLLVLAPDGSELMRMDRINTFQPELFISFLREALAVYGTGTVSASLQAARQTGDALAIAREARLDGEWNEASEALGSFSEDAPAEVWLERARMARTQRNAEQALDALTHARKASGGSALAAALDTEEGRVRLASGEIREASLVLERAIASDAGAEAGYHAGLCAWLMGLDEEASTRWRATARGYPGDLWAARADACSVAGTDGLLGESPIVRSMSDPRWFADEAYRARYDTRLSETSLDRDAVLERAIDFLLHQQRSDGSWPGSRWGGGGVEAPSKARSLGVFANIETAVTALACLALHGWRELAPERIDAALARGEARLLDESKVDRENVMWVYADGYRLLYFTRTEEDPDARSTERTSAMQGWIEALVGQQEETGGPFTHYTYTSSFVTASIAGTLLEALEAGLDVPFETLDKAAAVLEGTRDPKTGLFGYLVSSPSLNRTPTGAACRGPLCEETLYRLGRSDEERVGRALDGYLATYAESSERSRQSNFHVPALDGMAGYYFFHDFWAACEATRTLGARRGEVRAKLTEELLALPEADGAFIDSGFSYGKSYATAVALLSLESLEAP